MVTSATAYSNFIKVHYIHASMSEEREKEGTNFCSFVNLSQKRLYISHMFLVSLCASLRSANDRLIRLWLRCDFSALCIFALHNALKSHLSHKLMRPDLKILHMHFSCRQQHRIKISYPSHLRKVRNEAK